MRNYRGLTKDGKWVYGWYVNNPHGNTHIIIEPIDYAVEDRHDVLPETVGQSTGLKDKNGKEIYEGDKVLAYYEDLLGVRRKVRGLVVKGEFGYELEFASISVSMYHFYTDEPEDFEVIGNIHQEVKI